jgi:hypothetical protein
MMRDDDDDRPSGLTYHQWRQHLRDDNPEEYWWRIDMSVAAYEAACAPRDEEAEEMA